jgi:hypothetical protein
MSTKKHKFNASKQVGDVSNGERVTHALSALYAHSESQGDAYCPTDTTTDLLTNLAHFCDCEGLDFDKLVTTARMHWQAER